MNHDLGCSDLDLVDGAEDDERGGGKSLHDDGFEDLAGRSA